MSKDNPFDPSEIVVHHFPDRSMRRLLQDPDYVRYLVEIIAPDLVEYLDFGRGSQQNRTFISAGLRERESDVLLCVPFRDPSEGEEVLIYLLIEHQSSTDPAMGYRMLSYIVKIWEDQCREWPSGPGRRRRLSPILPIVFYTGDQRWSSPVSVTTVMDIPKVLERFVPRFDTLFLDVKTADGDILTKPGHPFGWLLRVLQEENAGASELREVLATAVSELSQFDASQVSQVQEALLYFILLILHRRSDDEREELIALVKQHSRDESEVGIMAQTAAELLVEQGKAEGIVEGKAEGIVEGKREAVLRLLQFRFQDIPETITEHIASIETSSDLDTLLEQAMTVQNLDDIQV